MKLNQRQLRQIISETISEARKVDLDDAVKQVQDAVRVLVKLGPTVAQYLDELTDAEGYGEGDDIVLVTNLDDAAYALDQLPPEIENMKGLVAMVKAAKKVTKQAAKGGRMSDGEGFEAFNPPGGGAGRAAPYGKESLRGRLGRKLNIR